MGQKSDGLVCLGGRKRLSFGRVASGVRVCFARYRRGRSCLGVARGGRERVIRVSVSGRGCGARRCSGGCVGGRSGRRGYVGLWRKRSVCCFVGLWRGGRRRLRGVVRQRVRCGHGEHSSLRQRVVQRRGSGYN